ncbi:hypothetical protein ACLOJK_038658 [Asimina triloba]
MGNLPNQQPPPFFNSDASVDDLSSHYYRSSRSSQGCQLVIINADHLIYMPGSRREPISVTTAAAMVALVRDRPINDRTRPSDRSYCW